MKQKSIWIGIGLLGVFVLWTMSVAMVDVQKIGPEESAVGFASLNGFVHQLTGVHMSLYTITDWLGLVPVAFGMGFAILGLLQWIKGKSFFKVDYTILALGGFYLLVIGAYILFEELVINYRPVLIDGILEASYPSSTTMLVMCVMPTAMMQLRFRIKNRIFKGCVMAAIMGFVIFMVIGRLISGVHWVTDIIGGGLLSTGMVALYHGICKIKMK